MCLCVAIIAPPDEKGTCNKCDEGQHIIEDGYDATGILVTEEDVHVVSNGGTKSSANEEDETQNGSKYLERNIGEDDVVLVFEGIAQEVDRCLEEKGTENEEGEGIEELYSVSISDASFSAMCETTHEDCFCNISC